MRLQNANSQLIPKTNGKSQKKNRDKNQYHANCFSFYRIFIIKHFGFGVFLDVCMIHKLKRKQTERFKFIHKQTGRKAKSNRQFPVFFFVIVKTQLNIYKCQ